VILHAQWTAISFYKACGFEETNGPFFEAGIKHIKMVKKA
jgi:predicted GNAT family N-acyltransferase